MINFYLDDSLFGTPCNLLTADKRKRSICTFCVGNMKKCKTELSVSSVAGGTNANVIFQESLEVDMVEVNDQSDMCHVVTPLTCRTRPLVHQHHYYYPGIDSYKDDLINIYTVH